MGGEDATPIVCCPSQMFKRIKRVEGERLRRAGNGLEVNPRVRNSQTIERPRQGGLQLLAFAGLPEFDFPVYEEQQFWRRTSGAHRGLVLRGCNRSEEHTSELQSRFDL